MHHNDGNRERFAASSDKVSELISFLIKCRLDIFDYFILGSIFSPSDTVAAVTQLKYKESPRLFSIIFGEAIANDAVGIILFQTFLSLKLKYSVS
jgi:NhaP-type Na+/H+ or K+/H+ antiporter